MEATKANDYAVARQLYSFASTMITYPYLIDYFGGAANEDINEPNRVYVLLGNELQKLYDRNPELVDIEPEPIWKKFTVLKSQINEILHYSDENSATSDAHLAKLERLCIIAGVEEPVYTSEQQELAKNAQAVLNKYAEKLDRAREKYKLDKQNNWQIPEYSLVYKPDGTILINNVLKLKKAHAGSTTERLLEQSIKNPNKLFKPDLGQTARNLSTVLNSAGFTPVLRSLFFPSVSSSNGVIFRPTITREQADNDKIDTTRLDLQLKELGATTTPKTR